MVVKRLLSLSAAMAVCFGLSTEAKEIRYNMYGPPSAGEFRMMDGFFKKLAGETNGKLTGKIFPGGQLLNAVSTLKGIGDGVVDGGFVVPTFNQGSIPRSAAISDMLFFMRDPFVAGPASAESQIFCDGCKGEHEKNNVVWLGSHGPDPWHLMCRSSIKSTSELRGKKIRVTGGAATRLAEAFGAVAVQLPGSEVGPALQGGQIDCAGAAVTFMRDFSLYDSVKTVIDYPLGAFAGLGAFVFNKDFMKSLDESDRRALLKLIPETMVSETVERHRDVTEVRKLAQNKGIAFVQPDQLFNETMERFRESEKTRYPEELKRRGVPDSEALVRLHLASIAKWQKIHAETGGDHAKYADRIRQEIYTKVLP